MPPRPSSPSIRYRFWRSSPTESGMGAILASKRRNDKRYGGRLAGLHAFDIGEELAHGAFHPAVECGRRERAAQARAAHLDLEHAPVEGREPDRAAMVVLGVSAARRGTRLPP